MPEKRRKFKFLNEEDAHPDAAYNRSTKNICLVIPDSENKADVRFVAQVNTADGIQNATTGSPWSLKRAKEWIEDLSTGNMHWPLKAWFIIYEVKKKKGKKKYKLGKRLGLIGCDYMSWTSYVAETGMQLHPNARGLGIGREAKGLLLDICFRVFKFHSVTAGCVESNSSSMRSLEGTGHRLYSINPSGLRKGSSGERNRYLHYIVTADWYESIVRPSLVKTGFFPKPKKKFCFKPGRNTVHIPY